MTKFERMKAVFDGEEPDRLPIFDLLCNDAVIEYYAGSKLTVENGPEVVPRAIKNMLDATKTITFPQKPGSIVDFQGFGRRIERWTSWIESRPFNNLSQLSDFAGRDIESLKSWKMARQEEDNETKFIEKLKNDVDDTVIFYPCRSEALCYVYNMCGLDSFIYFQMDYPKLAQEWIDAFHRATLEQINQFADPTLSPCGMIFSDMGFKKALIFSPSYLEKMRYFTRLTELCDAYHQKGLKVVYHSDGYIMDIIPELIKAGIDGLNPIEKAAGMDIREVKKLYGDKIIIVGGVDVSELLPYGTKDDIYRETRSIIRDVAPGGRFLIGSSSELGNDVPLENAITMIDTVKEFGKYPISA